MNVEGIKNQYPSVCNIFVIFTSYFNFEYINLVWPG